MWKSESDSPYRAPYLFVSNPISTKLPSKIIESMRKHKNSPCRESTTWLLAVRVAVLKPKFLVASFQTRTIIINELLW